MHQQEDTTEASEPRGGSEHPAEAAADMPGADDEEIKNVTAFTANEHGLNFLGESEVESKASQAVETQPSDNLPEAYHSTEGSGSWGDEVNEVPLDHGEAGKGACCGGLVSMCSMKLNCMQRRFKEH